MKSTADVTAASAAARLLTTARFAERRGFRSVEVTEIPYLRASSEGAAFLERAAPRALARGEPANACPAVGLSSADAADARRVRT
ncbi:MAG: hypothetical protein AAF360_05695, partial [Pseudomonadota bacterium]